MTNKEVIERLNAKEAVRLTKTNLKNDEVKLAILNFADENEKIIFLRRMLRIYDDVQISYIKEEILRKLYNFNEEQFLLKNIDIIRKDKELLLSIIFRINIISEKIISFETREIIFGKEITFKNIVKEIKGMGEKKAFEFLNNNFYYLESFYKNILKINNEEFIKIFYEVFDKNLTILKVLKKLFYYEPSNKKIEFILKTINLENDKNALIFLESLNNIIKMNDIKLIIQKLNSLDIYDFNDCDEIFHNRDEIKIFKKALEIVKKELVEEEYKKIIHNLFSKNKMLFNFLRFNLEFKKNEVEEFIKILIPVIKENYNNLEKIGIKFIKENLLKISKLDSEILLQYDKLLKKYKKPTIRINKKERDIIFKKIRNREKLNFENLKNYNIYDIFINKNEDFKEIIDILTNEYKEDGNILINNLFDVSYLEYIGVNIDTYKKVKEINKIQNKLFEL